MTDSNRTARIQRLEEEVRARAVDLQVRTTVRERLGAVPRELWQLIARLAELDIVIENTNHLDDDALLAFLLEFVDEPIALPDLPGIVMHIDVLGSGTDEDIGLYLRYYASDEDREEWLREFPGYPMPPRQVPPFDRDRFLPRAHEKVS